MRKTDSHIFKGMQRDLSVSKQPAEFLWDANNIRITAREGDTQMSVTNERGTKEIEGITFAGSIIGYCVLNEYLTVFTHEQRLMNQTEHVYDYIYRVTKESEFSFKSKTLYKGGYTITRKDGEDSVKTETNGLLGFDLQHPILTLGVYENEKIQKVYWTDGKNQPRLINIVKDSLTSEDVEYTDNSFDFVPRMQLTDSIKVLRRADSQSQLMSGVIQYAITYYNKYGQESNISCITPVLPTSFNNRAGSPEEKSGCAFYIYVTNPDRNFERIRLYSIFRTSLDAEAVCKIVADAPVVQEDETSAEGGMTMENTGTSESITIVEDGSEYSLDSYVQMKGSYSDDTFKSLPTDTATVTMIKTEEDWVDKIDETGERYLEIVEVTATTEADGILVKKDESNENCVFKITDSTGQTRYLTWGENTYFFFNTTDTETTYSCPTDNSYSKQASLDITRYVTGLNIEDEDAGTYTSAKFTTATWIGASEGYKSTITFVDNGTTGEDTDADALLYVGGESVTIQTMTQKDGTLFVGNITQKRPNVSEEVKTALNTTKTTESNGGAKVECDKRYAFGGLAMSGDSYLWSNSLNAKEADDRHSDEFSEETLYSLDNLYNTTTAGFKHGEHYRLGVQFQYETGKWSEPVFIKNMTEENCPAFEKMTVQNESGKTKKIGKFTVPTFKVTIPSSISQQLYDTGYRRARALITLPSNSDRLILAQGVLNPTVYSIGARATHAPDIQSSWFFRPFPVLSDGQTDDEKLEEEIGSSPDPSTLVKYGATVQYLTDRTLLGYCYRGAEIQGVPKELSNISVKNLPETIDIGDGDTSDHLSDNEYIGNVDTLVEKCYNIFAVDQRNVTMHSPDFEFSDTIANMSYESFGIRKCGRTLFTSNTGDISIETSSPTIGTQSTGAFQTGTEVVDKAWADKHLCAGLFYWDWAVDDHDGSYDAYTDQESEWAFMVYPWHRAGSLNNDCSRAAGSGTRSAVLEYKIVSNLKYSLENSWYDESTDLDIYSNGIALFNQDELAVVRVQGKEQMSDVGNDGSLSEERSLNYYGNIDTLLSAPASYGFMVSNGDTDPDSTGGILSGKTWSSTYGTTEKEKKFAAVMPIDYTAAIKSFWYSNLFNWDGVNGLRSSKVSWEEIGDDTDALRITNETVQMQYKSSPHLVIGLKAPLERESGNDSDCYLYMAELYREPNEALDFGGNTDEALKGNLWIPAGEAVALNAEADTAVHYDYGDTWYQRYDCLKTYPYSDESLNNVVEIGSFMVETHINIDGRYDKNRGQLKGNFATRESFNKINTVYSQLDNFFNYRILDSDYYLLDNYPTMISWSTQKSSGSEVDPWTAVTLASTLETDGTKGEITSLNVSKDTLYCFQPQGISRVLFNSRVLIPTSEGSPVEVSNNYKVDGCSYISTTIGSSNKYSIIDTPSGLYFIDGISNSLYLLADGLKNISEQHGLSYWFSQQDNSSSWIPCTNTIAQKTKTTNQQGIRCFYDYATNDLYVVGKDTALCYSEVLQSFVSFYNYESSIGMFNVGTDFYALRGRKTAEGYSMPQQLWRLFKGRYNEFFDLQAASDLTFISNADMLYDKVFTNIESRTDFYGYNEETDEWDNLEKETFFNTLQVTDEYQDTGVIELKKQWLHPSMQKKFRIWRTDIPRALKNGKASLDRIRNTWCKIKLVINDPDYNADSALQKSVQKMEMHDMGVIYYV